VSHFRASVCYGIPAASWPAPGGRAIVKFAQVFYVLDRDHRVLWVGGDWDDFARANHGGQAGSARVLGTPLDRHIAGEATMTVLRDILGAVQETGRTFRIPVRCDAPDLRRDLRMTVTPMSGGRVLLAHDLLDAQGFDRIGPGWAHDPGAMACKCSFCCALRTEGRWLDPLAEGLSHPLLVDYDVCPECRRAVTLEIARIRKAGRAV
jgi:hypothetical protein